MIDLDWHPDEKALARFGRLAPLGMGLLGGLIFWRNGSVGALWAICAIGLIAFCLSFTVPSSLRPLFLLAQGVGWLFFSAIGYGLMTVLFFGIFTPVGFFFRLIGRDALEREPKPSLSTYWSRTKPPRPREDYFHQS